MEMGLHNLLDSVSLLDKELIGFMHRKNSSNNNNNNILLL